MRATNKLLLQLQEDFAIKDLGSLHYFLGIEVAHHPDRLVLTQRKYIRDLLAKTNMFTSKGVPTPMLPTNKLSLDGGELLSPENATRYRSVVGALQYLLLIRPDLSFSVNRVCQYMAAPTSVHWAAVKRILRYMHVTYDLGLCFMKNGSSLLSAFSDAD
jgi:histone deacetylase 1/2